MGDGGGSGLQPETIVELCTSQIKDRLINVPFLSVTNVTTQAINKLEHRHQKLTVPSKEMVLLDGESIGLGMTTMYAISI